MNDREVDRRFRDPLKLAISGGTYRVSSAEPRTNVSRQTRRVTVPNTPGTITTVGGPLLLLGSLVVLAGIVIARLRDRLTPTAAALTALERSQFDEWITVGTLPEEVETYPTIHVDSLEGLVDVAVDTESRVIEDADATPPRYVVVNEGTRYMYAPADASRSAG